MLSWEAARFSQEGGWYVRLIWGLSKGRPYPVQQSISFRRVKSKQMNAVEIETDHRGDCCVENGAPDHDDSPLVPDGILLGTKDYLKSSHEDVSADGKQCISHFVIPYCFCFHDDTTKYR